MARIRTIKPEFPQSESMGRVSRDARLLFVELWTLCDDEGRTRGNSRMLASLLFPYDDDAPELIDGWIAELEREQCVTRYQADGSTYIEVRNWLNHQKIDKPSKSKIPSFDEASRIFSKPREQSSEDQGSRIKDQGVDQGPEEQSPAATARSTSPRFDSHAFLIERGVTEPVCRDWLALRKQKRAPVTETAINGIVREAGKAGMTLDAVLSLCCQRGWQGFKAEWGQDVKSGSAYKTVGQERAETIAALTGRSPPANEPAQAQGSLIEGEARRVAG